MYLVIGTSTVDRTGCPDFDNDGTSDINDPWTTPNPGFETEQILTSNQNYNDIEYSGDGYSLVTGSDDNFIRTWNSSTFVNLRSADMGSDVHSVAYSPDSNYVAAGVDDDTVHIFDANSMSSLHGAISVNVGSNERVYDVEFSPIAIYSQYQLRGITPILALMESSLSSMFRLAIFSVLNKPRGEDRFYDTAFSPDGNFIAVGSEGDWYYLK